jgi:Mannosyltransferase (PIG-V)
MKTPLRIPVWATAFGASRALIWVGVLFAFLWFTPGGAYLQHSHDLGFGLDIFSRFDSDWYVRIARSGYHGSASQAFYPLYPLLVAGPGRVFGGHYVVAGVVISLAACAGSFWLLWKVALPKLGREGASRAVVLLAVFPMSLFLQAVYAESLYLLLTLAAFALAERHRFAAAGICTGAAMLTRATGIALLPALALVAWREERRAAAFAKLALALPIFAVWPLYLWRHTHDVLAFAHAQRDWGRHLSNAGPVGGLVDGLRAAARGIHHIAVAHVPVPPKPGGPATSATQIAIQNVEAFAFVVAFIILAVVAWRRLGAAYGVFAGVSLAIPLAVPTAVRPLLSMPRFGLAIFPLFIAFSAITSTPRRYVGAVAVSALFCGIVLAQWAHYEWVS